MRILVDPGSHHLLNLGDVAMLEVCVERLRARWPAARVEVLTTAPGLLERHVPGAVPLPAAGRYSWLRQPESRGRRSPELRAAHALPARFTRPLLRTERARRGRRDLELRQFLDALLGADLFVMSGRGGIGDAFPDETVAVLEELRAANALGVPCALLSQGIGPLEDSGLRRTAARVLPSADLVAVREGRTGPRLLDELGVPADRVIVTGDDALALVPERPPAAGQAVGAGIRISPYSGMPAETAQRLSSAVTSLARGLGAAVEPLPVSRHPAEADAAALGSRAADQPETPADLIARIGGCRVVVSGSYHAAVFALGQGVPAVCVATSPYYRDKFLGLRSQFGDACEVVLLEGDAALERVADLAARAYRAWPSQREQLLRAARAQRAAGLTAYSRLGELVAP